MTKYVKFQVTAPVDMAKSIFGLFVESDDVRIDNVVHVNGKEPLSRTPKQHVVNIRQAQANKAPHMIDGLKRQEHALIALLNAGSTAILADIRDFYHSELSLDGINTALYQAKVYGWVSNKNGEWSITEKGRDHLARLGK